MQRLRDFLRDRLPDRVVKARNYCVGAYRTRQRHLEESASASWRAVARLLVRPHMVICCYPEAPYGASVLFRLCALSGCAVTTDLRRPAAAVFH